MPRFFLLFIYTIMAVIAAASADVIRVVGRVGSHECTLTFGGTEFKCALGKNGVSNTKVEGDGTTPAGSFPLRRILYREDRVMRPAPSADISVMPTLPSYGWCDDTTPASEHYYNTFIEHADDFPFSHEKLWRDDALYDTLAVIGYNDSPAMPGKGSAIFFHVTESYGATAGCVALALKDLQLVLAGIDSQTIMEITI